jgi:protein arginine kinase
MRKTVDNSYSHWMEADGPESGIAISSRVRIARNLAGMPFPHRLDQDKAEEVLQAVRQGITGGMTTTRQDVAGGEMTEDPSQTDRPRKPDQSNQLELSMMSDLSTIERQILVDKHLISLDLLKNFACKGVVLRDDELISIMVNEEDHLRIQCLLPGLQLREAWRLINQVDDDLEKSLDYAFSEHLGYLTACPTNVGTGLRASVMLHLPALVLAKQLKEVLNAISKVGLTARGLFGEGTEALGDLYQISNQITLGLVEEEIISNLMAVVHQIISQEKATRKALYQDQRHFVEDRVYRAYGILKNAHILSSEEAMRLFSDLRLGVEMDLLSGIPTKLLNELMVRIRPAFLTKIAGREMTTSQRDVFRADLIRKEFLAL